MKDACRKKGLSVKQTLSHALSLRRLLWPLQPLQKGTVVIILRTLQGKQCLISHPFLFKTRCGLLVPVAAVAGRGMFPSSNYLSLSNLTLTATLEWMQGRY